MVGAGILSIQAVTPLQGGSHLIIINDPTHQNASARSIHIHITPGKDLIGLNPGHSSTEDGDETLQLILYSSPNFVLEQFTVSCSNCFIHESCF